MKTIFNSLNLFQKIFPIFLFLLLTFLFRMVDSNSLLDPNLSSGGRILSRFWTYFFRSGVIPLVYGLTFLFYFLYRKDKRKDSFKYLAVFGFAFMIIQIVCIIFSMVSDSGYSHSIIHLVVEGLTISMFVMFATILFCFILVL